MIPKKIFQTFEHNNFGPKFQLIVDDWKLENPDYDYQFFDADDRKIFIRHYFDDKVYNAYTRIKPGAFKSDLWRYCVLFVHGGFYIDIDSICLGSLDMFLKDDLNFVSAIDLNIGDLEYHNVANAFIGSTPGHPILKGCIDRIVTLVEDEKLPPENLMNFCGPGCLGIIINQYLGRPDKHSMVGFQGKYKDIELITFENGTEFFRGLDGRKIMQNKNSSPILKLLYKQECNKVKNYFDWGLNGFKNVAFPRIVSVDSFQPSKEITTLPSYHNNKPAKFNLYRHCGISDCIRGGFKWEEHQHEVINKYLNSNSIAVDVGAHIGTLTVKLSMAVKEVHAFEPIGTSFDMLNKNLQLNNCNNVKTYKKGVGNEISIKRVKWISDGNAGGIGLEGGYLTRESNLHPDDNITVDLITLDSMNFEHIDYLKVDAEGYEELVIEGGKNTIKRDKPLIVIECFKESTFNSHIKDGIRATDEEINKRFEFLMKLGYIYEHLFFEDFLFIPPHLDRLKLSIER